jgi:hypothetical protein
MAIMSTGEYVPNAAAKALLREEHKELFVTMNEPRQPGSDPKDFTRFINEHTNKPKIQTQVYKRKHPTLDPSSPERSGPKWIPADTANS